MFIEVEVVESRLGGPGTQLPGCVCYAGGGICVEVGWDVGRLLEKITRIARHGVVRIGRGERVWRAQEVPTRAAGGRGRLDIEPAFYGWAMGGPRPPWLGSSS